MTMTDDALPLDELQARATRAVERYARGELAPHEATETLRTVAELFVASRAHFFTADGSPDWGGRTGAYRAFVNETFRAANVDRDRLTQIQSAVRYHIGNALREQLTPEQLSAIGLRVVSPRERSVETRAGRSATVSLFGAGKAITSAAEVAAMAHLVDVTLRRVDLAAVAAIEDAARAELRATLVSVRRTLAKLIDAAGTA